MKYPRFVEFNYYHKLVLKGKMTTFLEKKLWEWIEQYNKLNS